MGRMWFHSGNLVHLMMFVLPSLQGRLTCARNSCALNKQYQNDLNGRPMAFWGGQGETFQYLTQTLKLVPIVGRMPCMEPFCQPPCGTEEQRPGWDKWPLPPPNTAAACPGGLLTNLRDAGLIQKSLQYYTPHWYLPTARFK